MTTRKMHIQIAVDLDEKTGKHSITFTNLLVDAQTERTVVEAEDCATDEVAEEMVGIVIDYCADHDFHIEDDDDDGDDDEEKEG